MKLALFTARSTLTDRKSALEEAAKTAAEGGADLLVFPGWSLGLSNRFSHTTQKRIFQRLANKFGLTMIAEVGGRFPAKSKIHERADNTCCFRPNSQQIVLPAQHFSQGSNASLHRTTKLANDFLNKSRIQVIGKKRVGILLCGETAFLHNIRGQSNKPVVRHPEVPWPFATYEVLVNPSHSSMGQWNLLHHRLAYFSRKNRVAAYCTNNDHRSWKTALCVYRNGKLLMMGDSSNSRECQMFESDNWRMAVIAVI